MLTKIYFTSERLEKDETMMDEGQYIRKTRPIQETIPLSLVICKNSEDIVHINSRDMRFSWMRQKEQFLVFFASLLYLSKLPSVRIILFTDSLETYVELMSSFDKWPASQRRRLQFEMHDVEIERLTRDQMMQWRPCAWSKMYIPEMLHDVDATIYLDSDVLFLGPVEDLWSVFENMGKDASIAAAPEMWYVEEGSFRPAGGKFGINTGVMFMNLTRLRKIKLTKNLMKYKNMIPSPRHDQDVLNAYLKDHPRLLHEVSARHNFSPSSCQQLAPPCQNCIDKGILVLHGSDSSFFKLVDAKMKAVYRVFQIASMDLNSPLTVLSQRLEDAIQDLQGESERYVYMCQHVPKFDDQIMRHMRSLVRP
ncbi:Glycosyl transferase family 8 [Trinorchestia longiramus]|nr:Glycosyl transferase family 8 [Trinorchestia longiramus]